MSALNTLFPLEETFLSFRKGKYVMKASYEGHKKFAKNVQKGFLFCRYYLICLVFDYQQNTRNFSSLTASL